MKIAVVGGGGVGGYLAAKLHDAGFETTLISHSASSPLTIAEPSRTWQSDVPILPAPPEGKSYDVVIFATKYPQLASRARQMLAHIHDGTIVVPLLNGILPAEDLKKLYGPALVPGAVYIISHRTEDGAIRVQGKGAMVVMQEGAQKLAEALERSGVKVKLGGPEKIWQKYLFIAPTAALTAAYDKTFGEIAKEHLGEFEQLLDEVARAAKDAGVELGTEDRMRAKDLLLRSPAGAKSSLQLDIERCEEGELESIVGFMARRSEPFRRYSDLIRRRLDRCRKA